MNALVFRVLSILPGAMEHMAQDETVQFWEVHSGGESARLARCIVMKDLLKGFGIEADIQRAMPRKKLPTIGSVPVHEVAFCLHLPTQDLRIGPNGEQGSETIATNTVAGAFLLDHHWKAVPPEKIDFELGFMDLDARLPSLVAWVQARLLDNQSPAARPTPGRARF